MPKSMIKYSWNSNVVKYYNSLKQPFSVLNRKLSFIPVMAKLNFQPSLLKSSVSHDPSETSNLLIWSTDLIYCAQVPFIITSENSCAKHLKKKKN